MNLKYLGFVALTIFVTSYADAKASLVGISIGETHISDIKESHGAKLVYVSNVRNTVYQLDNDSIGLERIDMVFASCDNDGVVQRVEIKIPKLMNLANMRRLHENISSKYRYLSGDTSLVGEVDIVYKSDEAFIRLQANPQSFYFILEYEHIESRMESFIER